MSVPNWLGLLKWSIKQGDGTVPSDARPISAEDKDFLEKVMKECVQDEPARMQEIMNKMVNALEAGTAIEEGEVIEEELEELKYIVDQIDMAEIFNRFGGVQCLLRLMELDELALPARCQAAAVLGTVCQNNLKVQQDIFGKGALGRLVGIFESVEQHKLRTKVLFAISCLVRNLPEAEDAFIFSYAETVFYKAFLTDVSDQSALWSRALYLGAALLNPDNASVQRISLLSTILLPSSLAAMSSSALDTREGFLALLRAFIDYPIRLGAQTVSAHKGTLELMLASIDANRAPETVFSSSSSAASVAAVGATDEEEQAFQNQQFAHERTLLVELLQSLSLEADIASSPLQNPDCASSAGPSSLLLLDSPAPVRDEAREES